MLRARLPCLLILPVAAEPCLLWATLCFCSFLSGKVGNLLFYSYKCHLNHSAASAWNWTHASGLLLRKVVSLKQMQSGLELFHYLLTYRAWDAKGLCPEQLEHAFMLWWICWVLITMIVFRGLIGYVNIALAAVAKTCDSDKFREHDTQVCVAGLRQFLLFHYAFASGKRGRKHRFYFLCLLNMCLVYNIFHSSCIHHRLCVLEKTKLGHDSSSQKLDSVQCWPCFDWMILWGPFQPELFSGSVISVQNQ